MKTYHVEILTPCFCAGADQTRAEIRVPSIRGQLRWWFRALGGTAADEKAVFGGVHNGAVASAVVLRVSDVRPAGSWKPFDISPNSHGAYVWYFASIAGKKRGDRERHGPRWRSPQGALMPGTRFELVLFERRPLEAKLRQRLDEALEAFLRFGTLGMRGTRGLGALAADEFDGGLDACKDAASRLLGPAHFKWLFVEKPFPDAKAALDHAGSLLKWVLRKKCNVRRMPSSPLGASEHPRQTSAVRFRPIRVGKDDWRLMLLEAPHERVLERASCRPEPLLKTCQAQLLNFTAPPPQSRGHQRPGGGRPSRG